MMDFKINTIIIQKRNFIIFAIAGILFLNIVPFPALSPILILLFSLISGVLIISIFAPEDFNFLLNLYLIGSFLRFFLGFVFYIFSFIFKNQMYSLDDSPGFLFPNDGWSYSQQGLQIAKFAERGIEITMANFMHDPNMKVWGSSGNITAYDFFASFVYSITGYSPLSLFFISAFAGSMAALFVYLIAKELFNKKVARISSLLVFFWPSFIMWATQNLKETMIAMFICILLWTIFYMHRYPLPGFLLLSIASVWALLKIGPAYLVAVICAVFLVALFLLINHLLKNKSIAVLAVCLLCLLAFFLFKEHVVDVLALKYGEGSFNIKSYNSIFSFLNYHRSVRSYGRLQFFEGADISSLGKTMAFAPLGLLYAIFAPFPWQVGSFMQIMAVPETLIFYILFPFTLKGIIFAYKKRFNQGMLLLSVIMIILLLLGLVEGNSGTLFRHRSIAFHLLFVFTGLGISLKKNEK